MRTKKFSVFQSPDPCEHALEVIGGKWRPQLLSGLHDYERMHYGDLRKFLGLISDTVLSSTLRDLIKKGVIEKIEEDDASFAYQLTEKGEQLIPILWSLRRWSNQWKEDSTLSDPLVACQDLSQAKQPKNEQEILN